MNDMDSMMENIAASLGRRFVMEECIEACAELIVTLQRFKSCPNGENMGVAQADISDVVLWCGIASVFFGMEGISASVHDKLHEVYRVACRRNGAANA